MSLSYSQINTNEPKNGACVNYSINPPALQAEIIPGSVAPSGTQSYTTTSSQSRLRFEIPTGGENEYLLPDRAFLRFTIGHTTTWANGTGMTSNGTYQQPINCYLDGAGASSVIRQITIKYGSKNIEDTPNYNTIFNFNFLNNVDPNDAYTRWSSAGYSNNSSHFMRGPSPMATVTTTTATAGSVINQPSYEVCVPLMSSVVGFNASKALAIGLMVDKLIIDVYFEDFSACFIATETSQTSTPTKMLGTATTIMGTSTLSAPTSYSISNANFHYDILKLSSIAQSLVSAKAIQDGGITMPINKWASFPENVVTQSSTAYNKLIDPYYSNVKSVYVSFQPISNKTDLTKPYQSCFVEPNLNSYYFKIGSKTINNPPIASEYYTIGSTLGQTGVKNRSWMYTELSKAFHATHNVYDTQQLYTPVQYSNSDVSSQGAFLIGLDCELYEGLGDILQEGTNMIGKGLTFYMTSHGINSAYTYSDSGYAITNTTSKVTADTAGLYCGIFVYYSAYLHIPVIEGQFAGSIDVYE